MKKIFKAVMSFVLVVALAMVTNVSVFAADSDFAYREVLRKINQEYDLDLEYIAVENNQISLKDYEKRTRQLAIQQRQLLDYIENLEVSENTPVVCASGEYVNKTKTKDVSDIYGAYFSITAHYTVYDNARISSYSGASLNTKPLAIINNVFLTDISGPEFILLNTTRTLAVRYHADIHYDSAPGYGNVVLQAEFHYND